MSPLAEPTTCVIVADRGHLAELARFSVDPVLGGGGWSEGVQLFAAHAQIPYLVLAAYEKRRIARRAPLVLLARNEQGLRHALSYTVGRLDDVTCAWLFFCTSETRAIAEPILAAESRTEGTA